MIVISGLVPAVDVLAATVALGVALIALAQRVKVYGPSSRPQAVRREASSGLARQ